MKKIGFVAPWYGKDIPGGAEAELRGIVKQLSAAGVGLEVLTTCARELSSDWNVNYHKEGMESVDGIPVRRFAVRKRDAEAFNTVNYKFMNRLLVTEDEEKVFLREMINSPELYDYMRDHQAEYELFVHIPYMFGTTYYGILACPEKAVLIPCFHDESYAYMRIYKKVFSRLKGIIFLSKPEQQLANRLYDLSAVKQGLLGAGVDSRYIGDPQTFRKKHNIDAPFVLYAGRKDKGKHVDVLLSYFLKYKEKNGGSLKLVLIGGGQIDIPGDIADSVLDLGFVPAQEKFDAYSAATLLCQPSPNESFSLVIMESWLMGRPVLVYEKCEVTQNFVREAKGGLYFMDYPDFEGCLNYVLENPDIAVQMGENGRAYVNNNFIWPVVVRKYTDFLKQCSGEGSKESEE